MEAGKIRKGNLIKVFGVTVRVTKREKWNSKRVKLHFEDTGFGLPLAQFGSSMLTINEKMFNLNELVEIL